MTYFKAFATVCVLSVIFLKVSAQDIVVISEGNFIRGTIKGTDYSNVAIKNEEGISVLYKAKDIKEFLWNGETYVSKPIVLKNKMEHRFFKLVEQGVVNLYTVGGNTTASQPKPKRSKVRPSIGIGGGTGGLGGIGGGVGITIGGGRSTEQDSKKQHARPTAYFIEKFGTGPMLEIPLDGGDSDSKNQHIKNVLLQKLNNDQDLADRINATGAFDAKLIRAFVAAYNSMKR